MTHTPDELRAAIKRACYWLETNGGLLGDPGPEKFFDSKNDAAILRAHLESFDEERAFLAEFAHYWPMLMELIADGGYMRDPWQSAFEGIDEKWTALVAKREEKCGKP